MGPNLPWKLFLKNLETGSRCCCPHVNGCRGGGVEPRRLTLGSETPKYLEQTGRRESNGIDTKECDRLHCVQEDFKGA
jgi:hypothetical protein